MCAAQSNPQQSFGYTWGFADNSRADSVLEMSPNISYTVSSESMPYLLTDGSITMQKDVKNALAANKGSVVRRMFVVNEPFPSGQRVITTSAAPTVVKKQEQQVLSLNCDKNYLLVDHTDQTHALTNGIVEQKAILTAAPPGSKTHYSPIGPIQLTAEECNEILMKRALAASQQTQTITTTDAHTGTNDIIPGISVQVQKVIQGLEDQDDSQGDTPNLKLEPGTLELSPKTELQESINFSDNDTTIKKERPFSCDECGKSFLLKHHLTTHARVHTGERPHVCPHCGKSFAHKHCLNTHLLLHSTERPYQCAECKKSFTLKHHLLTHSRVHSRDRPFVCQECGRSFPLKRHLVTHSKFHAGERPFVCEECGESFAQENHLIMHSRFHGSINPFVCPDCGVTFPRKFQLVNHGRVHGKVPHSCTVCGKEFLQKRTLVSHMRIHTGDHPYPCISCGEGFLTKAELNQHFRNSHGGVNPNSSSSNVVPTNTIITTQQPAQNIQLHQTQQQHHQQQHQQQQQQQQQTQAHPQTITVISNSANAQMLTVTANDGSGITRPQFVCRECGSAFNSREALALHLRLHTGDKTLMTDLCALTAALPPNFLNGGLNPNTTVVATNPNIVAQNSVPVQIISSTGQVVTQTTLVQAAASTHPQTVVTTVPTVAVQQQQHTQMQPAVVAQQQTPPKPKSHFCQSCGKGFAAKHGLMQHTRRHPNGGCTVRTHVCECGKAFFQKNHLMLHQRQHLETKPVIAQQQTTTQ
ncbi:zinc finger protein 135 isoform X2 [Teleopsis dalmanni]|uniref:zinc finger protein 135 isoform X2 n=1 Tax=Teleopsis dalmanni TaxID=139649 RepID=UPI0018CCF98C|nr:zinc finger protein 135 isoform X2 [Teleopsis dalmanni]